MRAMPRTCCDLGRQACRLAAMLMAAAACWSADVLIHDRTLTVDETVVGGAVTMANADVASDVTLTAYPTTRFALQPGAIVRSGGVVHVRMNTQTPSATGFSLTATQNGPGVAATLIGNDPEGAPLSYTVTTAPTKGTLSGSGANLTYTPTANAIGSDGFDYTVSDGSLTSSPATMSIAIVSVPIITNGPTADTGAEVGSALHLTVTATDAGGEAALIYTWSLDDGPASVTFPAANGTNDGKDITIIPTADGTYEFRVTVANASNHTATATVSVAVVTTVFAVPDQFYACAAGSSQYQRPIKITAESPGPFTCTITQSPTHGTATIVSGSSFNYVPTAGYTGVDSFTVTASDGASTSLPGVITMTVGVDATRSLLIRPTTIETFNAASWSSNAVYRRSYLAEVVPGRVWATAAAASTTPILAVVGPMRKSATVGSTVAVSVRTAAHAPVTFVCDGIGSFTGGASVRSVQADAAGLANVVFQCPPNPTRTAIMAGSPSASGTQRMLVEVKP